MDENDRKRLQELLTQIRKILNLEEDIYISVVDLFNTEKRRAGYRITIDIPLNQILVYLSKWQNWKNAYKYWKRYSC